MNSYGYAALILQTATVIHQPLPVPAGLNSFPVARNSHSVSGPRFAFSTGMYADFADTPLKTKFLELSDSWKAQTMFSSSSDEILSDQNYLAIIALGQEALPLIFEDLEQTSAHWFQAIEAILSSIGQEPPEIGKDDYGRIDVIADIWLDWARENNYLS